MERALILAFLITLLFFVSKIIEMKYISKEWKPLKIVIRDSVIVFISGFISIVLFFMSNGDVTDFFNVITENKTLKPSATEVFTGEPGF
tara:strand:- start:61 stop:327 length:267 start_codon:yes stop_codon:yes gene_type:complete